MSRSMTRSMRSTIGLVLTGALALSMGACTGQGETGNTYFNRSGPSLFETPELLAEMLHPAVFAPRHEGSAWTHWLGAT